MEPDSKRLKLMGVLGAAPGLMGATPTMMYQVMPGMAPPGIMPVMAPPHGHTPHLMVPPPAV